MFRWTPLLPPLFRKVFNIKRNCEPYLLIKDRFLVMSYRQLCTLKIQVSPPDLTP